jgi:pyruvate dehydrogenase E2 component (dihydrolipoamide acetyltransferase)
VTVSDVVPVEVPDIGDFSDVPIIEIIVSPGDQVGVDDPLLTLESDKATMDVPSPFEGVVKELQVQVGDKVSQGTVLLTLETSGDDDSSGSTAAAAASEGADSEAEAPASVGSAAEAEGGAAPAEESAPPHEPPEVQADGGGPIYASPSVRRLARELGVDLSQVSGSGRKGRITKDDVQKTVEKGPATAAPAGPGLGLSLAPWPSVNFEKFGPVERVQRSRIQRIAAPNLARNWVMIPHVTQNDEADITDLEAWRKQLNAEQDVKVTMVSFLVVACVATLKELPAVNSSALPRTPPAAWWSPSSRKPTRRACSKSRGSSPSYPQRLARGSSRQPRCRAPRSRSPRSVGSGEPRSRRSSTPRRSRSSASAARR